MTTLLLVDSLDAVASARAAHPNGVLATDNPLLADVCGALDLDALIERADADRLGQFSVELAQAADAALDCDAIAERFGLVRGHIRLAARVTRLIAGQVYRGAALARGLAAQQASAVVIHSLDREPAGGAIPPAPERFEVAWPRLARLGFFDPLAVTTQAVQTALPSSVNDTASRSLARRLAGLPPSAVLGVLATHPAVGRLLRRLGRPTVILEKDNETIREALGALALRGVAVMPLARSGAVAVPSQQERDGCAALVADVLVPLFQVRLNALGEFTNAQAGALTRLLAWHYAGALEQGAFGVARLRDALARTLERAGRPTAVLANALSGVEGAHMLEICRRAGVPLFDFEHGVTTGLSRHSESKIAFSEVVNCDEMMVCSPAAAESFRRAGPQAGRVNVVGLADQVRGTARPWLQRRLARRALGIGPGAPVVMHVATVSLQGNMRAGPAAYTERAAVDLNRRLIGEAYGPLAGWRVLFKDYPTQRFPFEPDCESYAGKPDHLTYVRDEDFRYLRSAPDVLVTMMPTSTLGWCVGTNLPLVWLESPYLALLSDDAARAFRDAFFVVDLARDDWPEHLRALLSRGVGSLRAEWRAKAPARKLCLERFIAGPPGSPGRAAAGRILHHLKVGRRT